MSVRLKLTPEELPNLAKAVDGLTKPPVKRGTSNRNQRGSSTVRRERRQWLIETYRADIDIIRITYFDDTQTIYYPTNRDMAEAWADTDVDGEVVIDVERIPACRCYRCGALLHEGTVTADRIKPGCKGGTYSTPKQDTRTGRTNIRPACGGCNSETGGALASHPTKGGRS